jgi:hypothetical protein
MSFLVGSDIGAEDIESEVKILDQLIDNRLIDFFFGEI